MTLIDRLAALDAAATPGPWLISEDGEDLGTVWQERSGGAIAWPNLDNETGGHHPVDDARLIAELRTALPAILAALRAAKDVMALVEPDDDFDGEFIDYLAPHEAVEALRTALAALDQPEGSKG